MDFALVVCTYMRPRALVRLLDSVTQQSLYPNQIIVVDASDSNETEIALTQNIFKNLYYYHVDEHNKGLTKQRNFGIDKLDDDIDVVCFLDDDIVLERDYFENLVLTYSLYPDAIAIGGYITNEVIWQQHEKGGHNKSYFYYDGWKRREPFKMKLRRWLGLHPLTPPGLLSPFSHGRSISFLPPTGKTYQVEHFMGGVSSYKTEVIKQIAFSTYFEGYGLYEDVDFCIRLLPFGNLYVNTAARVQHYHDSSGRPNHFKYGKMVIRNGWYVWRLKNKTPSFKNRLKWHLVSLVQTVLRFLNIFNSNKRSAAFTDSLGRCLGWLSLWINKPKHTE